MYRGASRTLVLIGRVTNGADAACTPGSAARVAIVASGTRVTIVTSCTTCSSTRVAIVATYMVTSATMFDGTAVVASEASCPVVRTTGSVETMVEIVASVAPTIAPEHAGMIVVEIAYAVVAIDGEVPGSTQPGDRVEEVVGCCENVPLPVEQDMAQVGIAVGQVVAVNDVFLCRQVEKVIEIDFVAVVVLLVVEVQFISHLVREETGFFASAFVAHCLSCHCAASEDEGEDQLFHSAILFLS